MCGDWGVVRLAPELLRHISLLLALWGGAGLATGARLKWDPSTYVVVREVFPREYRAAAAVLASGGAALVALGHLALAALRAPSRPLLLLYAALMATLLAAEAALALWARAQLAAWLGSDQARDLEEALEVRHHLQPLLRYLGKWHPLPSKVKAIIEEAEADLPRNAYVGAAAGALMTVLQVSAVLLAVLTARGVRGQRAGQSAHLPTRRGSGSGSGVDERAPLEAVYRGGRLVVS